MTRDNGAIIWGFTLITAGLIFLLSNAYGINAWKIIITYWPLILIFIGAWIIHEGMKENKV